MKKLFLLLLIALVTAACDRVTDTAQLASAEQLQSAPVSPNNQSSSVDAAYENRASNVEVEGEGIVVKILPDDNKVLEHQKFLVKVASGKTLLFAHNIDLASRIEDLKIGDDITFKGEYVFNPKGGVIHWTHRDPKGEHAAGWIKRNGQKYE